MKSLTVSLARLCKTLNKYEIAHDDKPPPKRAVADVFRVLPSSEELVTLYTTTLRSDIAFGWYAEDVTLYAVSHLLQRQVGYRWAVGKHDRLLPGRSASRAPSGRR